MKKVFTLLVIFAFIASAQVKFGITGGANFSNFYGDDANPELDKRTAFSVGIFIDNVNDGWGFQPELLYSMKGAKLSSSHTSISGFVTEYVTTEKYDYVELPMFVRYRIPVTGTVKPVLHAGPYMAFLVSAKEKVSTTESGNTIDVETDIKDPKTLDAGLRFGAGVNFEVGTGVLGLSADYSFSMLNINGDATVKNSCFSIMAAYSF